MLLGRGDYVHWRKFTTRPVGYTAHAQYCTITAWQSIQNSVLILSSLCHAPVNKWPPCGKKERKRLYLLKEGFLCKSVCWNSSTPSKKPIAIFKMLYKHFMVLADRGQTHTQNNYSNPLAYARWVFITNRLALSGTVPNIGPLSLSPATIHRLSHFLVQSSVLYLIDVNGTEHQP